MVKNKIYNNIEEFYTLCFNYRFAKEYWRLQGYSDEDFEKALNTGIPYIELYKQAGNAITYNVLYVIFKELLLKYSDIFTNNFEYISLFSGIGSFEMVLRDLLNS